MAYATMGKWASALSDPTTEIGAYLAQWQRACAHIWFCPLCGHSQLKPARQCYACEFINDPSIDEDAEEE